MLKMTLTLHLQMTGFFCNTSSVRRFAVIKAIMHTPHISYFEAEAIVVSIIKHFKFNTVLLKLKENKTRHFVENLFCAAFDEANSEIHGI